MYRLHKAEPAVKLIGLGVASAALQHTEAGYHCTQRQGITTAETLCSMPLLSYSVVVDTRPHWSN